MSMPGDRRGLLQVRIRAAGVAGAAAAAGMLASCGVAGSGGGASPGITSATAAGLPGCALPGASAVPVGSDQPLPGPAGGQPGAAGQPGSFVVGGQLNGVAAPSATGVWAAGDTALGNPVTVRWDGRTWAQVLTPLGDPLTSGGRGEFDGVAAVSTRDAWAVGVGPYNKALVEHWDGRAWSPVPVPDPGAGTGGGTTLQGAAAASAADAWAVGGTRFTGKTVIIHWNGAAWTVAPSPTPAGNGTAIIEQWNGTAWSWPAGFCASPSGSGCVLPNGGTPSPIPPSPQPAHT